MIDVDAKINVVALGVSSMEMLEKIRSGTVKSAILHMQGVEERVEVGDTLSFRVRYSESEGGCYPFAATVRRVDYVTVTSEGLDLPFVGIIGWESDVLASLAESLGIGTSGHELKRYIMCHYREMWQARWPHLELARVTWRTIGPSTNGYLKLAFGGLP